MRPSRPLTAGSPLWVLSGRRSGRLDLPAGLLARGEADAAVIVGSDPGAHFPRVCNEHLARIPTILFDPYPSTTTHVSTVQIPSAVNGIDADGTAYRMDGIPIKTRKVLEMGYPTDTELFEKIYRKVAACKDGGGDGDV